MSDRLVTRGFVGRRRAPERGQRVPPGQYLTNGFPVLSAGPTPHTPLESWTFSVDGLLGSPRSWTWPEFTSLPSREFVVDISCVTKWTKLDMRWHGVSLDTLLEGVELEALAERENGLRVVHTFTRSQPPGWTGYSRRIDMAMISEALEGTGRMAQAFVCGPTPLVEVAAEGLVELGLSPGQVKTERFGPSGG